MRRFHKQSTFPREILTRLHRTIFGEELEIVIPDQNRNDLVYFQQGDVSPNACSGAETEGHETVLFGPSVAGFEPALGPEVVGVRAVYGFVAVGDPAVDADVCLYRGKRSATTRILLFVGDSRKKERERERRDITYPFWEELPTKDCSTFGNLSPEWNTDCRVHAQSLFDDSL